MRTTIIKAALGIAIALNAFLAGAQSVGELRFGNERTDTVRLTELLDAGAAIDTDNCGRAAFFAHQFIGIPYPRIARRQRDTHHTARLPRLHHIRRNRALTGTHSRRAAPLMA